MYKPYSPPRAYKNLKIPTQTPPSAQGTWGSGLRRRSNAFPNKKQNKKWPRPEPRSIHFHLRALFFFFRARAGGGVKGFGARASRAPPGAPRTPTPARVAPAFETASEAMREQTLSPVSPQTSARDAPDPHRPPIAAPGEPAAERKKKKTLLRAFRRGIRGAVFLFRRKTRGAGKKPREAVFRGDGRARSEPRLDLVFVTAIRRMRSVSA